MNPKPETLVTLSYQEKTLLSKIFRAENKGPPRQQRPEICFESNGKKNLKITVLYLYILWGCKSGFQD